jgi:hypothetical protein
MMHGLAVQQIPAKKVLCNKDVFEHVWMLPGSWMIGNAHDHIPGFMSRAASPPIAVELPSFTPTFTTGRRFQLFRTSTATYAPPSTRGTPKVAAGGPKDPLTLPTSSAPHRVNSLLWVLHHRHVDIPTAQPGFFTTASHGSNPATSTVLRRGREHLRCVWSRTAVVRSHAPSASHR